VKGTTVCAGSEQALRNEVMIYSIIDVPIEASAGRDLGGEHALITLSEQTGGKSFYASAGGLDKAFAQVSDDLRTQYVLGYYPHHQEPGLVFHRLNVTIPRARMRLSIFATALATTQTRPQRAAIDGPVERLRSGFCPRSALAASAQWATVGL